VTVAGIRPLRTWLGFEIMDRSLILSVSSEQQKRMIMVIGFEGHYYLRVPLFVLINTILFQFLVWSY